MPPAMRPKVRGDLAAVELDGEAVVFDESDGSLHHLNSTATIVFSFCDGASTVKEISSEIAQAFEAEASQVEREVRKLLRSFRESGLLDGNGGSGRG